MILLFVVIPLSSAFLISLLGKRVKWFSDTLSNLASFSLLVLSFLALSTLNSQLSTVLVYNVGGWQAPIGISLVIDGLACFMLIVVNLVALLVNRTGNSFGHSRWFISFI